MRAHNFMKFAQIVLDLVNLSMASFVIVPPGRKDKLQTMKVDMDSFVSHIWQFGSPDVGVSSPVSKLKQPTRDLDTCTRGAMYPYTVLPAYPHTRLQLQLRLGLLGLYSYTVPYAVPIGNPCRIFCVLWWLSVHDLFILDPPMRLLHIQTHQQW